MAKKTNQKQHNKGSKQTVTQKDDTPDKKKAVWCFDKIDRAGKFAFDLNRPDFLHKEVLSKMVTYNNMTWTEIKMQTHDSTNKSKHHTLKVESLSSDARKRLSSIQMEEYADALFSFALQNKLRIIGYREKEFFHVMWYDPYHQVAPSHK